MQAAAPFAGEEVRGELNSWGSTAWIMTGSLGSTFLYDTGQVAGANDSSSEFKFYKSDSGGLWYGKDSPNMVTFGTIFTGVSTGGGNERNLRFDHVQNKYYVFKWNGNDKGVIFQFSSPPATITGVSRLPVAPTSSDAVVVTAITNATPPSEQALWLRYTSNNWSSSAVVEMTGSGTSYSASIPAQVDGTQVSYYVFSSGDVTAIAGGDADLMTINYDNNGGSNYNYSVGNPIGDAQALWVNARVMAWNGTTSGVTQYRLLYDPDGAVATAYGGSACTASPAGPCYVALTATGAISTNQFPKNPNANGLTRLDLPGSGSLSAATIKTLLQGQVVVAAYNGSNGLVDVTRVQIQGVLDDLYVDNGTAGDATLGVTYSGSVPTVRVWAPTAKAVTLRRYATSTGSETGSHAMTLDTASGVWSVLGDATWDRQFYLFDVQVYVPSVDQVVNNLVTDPYAVTLSPDSTATTDPRSQFVNLADADLKPADWDGLTKPALNPEDIVIYETHIRDFSINDTSVTDSAHRGTYLAFTYDGRDDADDRAKSNGMDHLQKLQAAGLTHIHLLPTFDIASVPENSVPRSVSPNPTGYARDSDQPQSIVGAGRATDGFNWGYDPYHYGAPEGSYASDPDGAARVREFRAMVKALSDNELRVVMDVVYNHTAASGQGDKSVLDKVVPGYYYRYTTDGALYTDSCCDDTASEYAMFEKLMVDTLKRWAVEYKVDSFRFDLMNFHTRQNMLNVKTALTAVNSGIYLYGEGWDFGSAADKGLTTCPNCYAKQANMTGTGIGSFNDKIRDAAHGGYSADDLGIRKQGYINGLSYDWNGYYYSNRDLPDLNTAMDVMRSALRGSGTDWNGQGQPFTDDPQESVPYVEKHDNETLFDQNVFKLPSGVSMADRVRVQNLGTSVIALAQGVPFFQMGQDILRSKSLDRNSYDSGDWFNRVDWSYGDGTYSNNFGVGLPPWWDNQSRWDIMGPHLTNTALDPSAANAQASAAHLREMLRIRQSSPLFRLTTEAEINARVGFYNTANNPVGLLVMGLSDAVGDDLDSSYETILVFFNANKTAATYTIAGANGFSLHPLQADVTDADAVVQTASFNDGTDTFSIPARTTAVFVSTQAITPSIPPSTIDWVGKLWPRGGVANQINQGAFAPAGFDIFVRVYDYDVTEAAGAPSGIACSLYWGKYGSEWTSVPMTWNVQQGNDDEFKATLTQATLNALAPGTYGFTAYCQRAGEDKKWKTDSYDIGGNTADDDQGDGLITVIPTADSSAEPPGGVFVHLFEWRWTDVQKECVYLASKGYTGVQVSPPNEHLVPTADQGGQPASDYPWWARYQPVTHDTSKFTSRSGTWAEFTAMVDACNAVGVDIIVDAVINHMADIEVPSGVGAGTAGTAYDSTAATRYYGSQYAAADFHTDCSISSYSDRSQVQTCKLSGLPDLNTGRAATQVKLQAYLQSLIDNGVKGFRIDGAKHIAAQDLAAILNGLTGDFYVFQEAIDAAGEPVRDWEYTPNGDVTEFAYPYAIGLAFDDSCTGSLSDLETRFSASDMLPSRFAQVFTDNHDNQRGHAVGAGQCIVDHRDGQEHVLANIFALAYPYGHPSVMSSYYWQSSATDNTGDSKGPPSATSPYTAGSGGDTRPVYGAGQGAGDTPANCSATFEDGKWACEHRRTATANMVKFRQATAGQSVTNWQTVSANHIAFGLGAKGFVAINRTASAATRNYQTGLPAGDYCDIIHYDFTDGRCVLPGTTTPAPASSYITVDSSGQIVDKTVASMDAFAIHVEARIFTAYLPSISGGVLQLSWPTHPAAASYRVLREPNAPYFDPANADDSFTPGSNPWPDPSAALSDVNINHYYLIQALNASNQVIGTSGWMGEFTFGLTPGS
jgi:pullulanase/glycogen debranching enzyme